MIEGKKGLMSDFSGNVSGGKNTVKTPPVNVPKEFSIYETNLIPADNTRVAKKYFHNASASTNLSFVEKLTEPENKTEVSAESLVTSLATKYFKNGRLSESKIPQFEKEVSKLLSEPANRDKLIGFFKLDSSKNKSDLVSAMSLEAGYDKKQNTFPVGAVMLNRAMATNIVLSAAAYSKNKNFTGFVPKTISNIIHENGQFAISKSRFKTESAAHDKTPGAERFKLNNEVVKELMEGRTKFTLNGKETDTSNLYYFQRGKYPVNQFRTENGHHFAIHCNNKKSAYFVYNSFGINKIDWNS